MEIISTDIDIDEIISNTPNFRTNIYKDPNYIYIKICVREKRIREALDAAELRKCRLSSEIAEKFINCDTTCNVLQQTNNHMFEIRRAISSLMSYRDRIVRTRLSFEGFFTLLYERPAYQDYVFQCTERSNFKIFDKLEHVIEYYNVDEEGKSLSADVVEHFIRHSPETLNFIRFHSFQLQYNKAIYFEEVNILCIAINTEDKESILFIDGPGDLE